MSQPIYWINELLGMMPVPRGGEQLASEIARLAGWGVNVLVSLLPAEESQMLGLERQQELCEANGIRLIRLPIEDFSVPGDMEAVMEAVSEAHRAMESGQKVVVHCRGGIGRSSLFAGALLVRRGEQAEEAFSIITRCRGCRVPETGQQELWLGEFGKRLKDMRGS